MRQWAPHRIDDQLKSERGNLQLSRSMRIAQPDAVSHRRDRTRRKRLSHLMTEFPIGLPLSYGAQVSADDLAGGRSETKEIEDVDDGGDADIARMVLACGVGGGQSCDSHGIDNLSEPTRRIRLPMSFPAGKWSPSDCPGPDVGRSPVFLRRSTNAGACRATGPARGRLGRHKRQSPSVSRRPIV